MPHVVATCSSVRTFTGGVSAFEVEADTVRRMIGVLDARYPGLGEHIRRKLAIAVDGDIHQDAGDIPLTPTSEVVLIAKIGGG